MSRFFLATRYLIIIPIIGLGLAAAAFFLFGGINLIVLLFEAIGGGLGLIEIEHHGEEIPVVIEVVEHVHQFLIGTVLYITAIGFYQLFIKEIEFPGWLKIESTDELETALVGVTVVVLAVNFLAQVFTGPNVDILTQGAGIALPIAALGYSSASEPGPPDKSAKADISRTLQKLNQSKSRLFDFSRQAAAIRHQ